MKTLIYQFWSGKMPEYARASRHLFKDYARSIGAEYRFDENPRFFRVRYARYYHSLRPVFDADFHAYDRVLFADMDVFPVEELRRNVFDEPVDHVALVQEPEQDELRKIRVGNINLENDRRWAAYVERKWNLNVPRGPAGNPDVFNTGVILYSRSGMEAGRALFPSPRSYMFWMKIKRFPWFYRIDQNYLSAFAFLPGMRFSRLNQDWNSQIFSTPLAAGGMRHDDFRTPDSALVHFQYYRRNKMNVEEILAMVNDADRA